MLFHKIFIVRMIGLWPEIYTETNCILPILLLIMKLRRSLTPKAYATVALGITVAIAW